MKEMTYSSESKINFRDYGFDTPAEMAFVAWAGEMDIMLSVNHANLERFTVTEYDNQAETMTIVNGVTGESHDVTFSDITWAHRVL